MSRATDRKPSAPICERHGVALVCPKCQAAKGGKKTAKKHGKKKLSAWGKMGGRPRKAVADE
ncbi:MAG TPA: hypothetical protein VKW06_00705 [Candidatus Angelobacter sp.]|nr:hypothetical protein [Candidatus Angelobacter sp.]